MLGRTVAPALAMGNACVLKPAEDTTLSALYVGQLALEVGIPPGVLNVVTGLGDEAGLLWLNTPASTSSHSQAQTRSVHWSNRPLLKTRSSAYWN